MSHLSAAEVTAGISRAAMATLRKNGNGSAPHTPKVLERSHPPVVDRSAEPGGRIPAPATSATIGDGCKELAVIDTPYRKLSVLEMRDGLIVLRDVAFVGTKADVALIHLEREQSHALAIVLQKVSQ